MTHGYRIPLLATAALLLLGAPSVLAQGDLSGDSPLAIDSPLVELLLAQDWTREEMAQRLLRALEVAAFQPEDCVPGEEIFADVPASNPFCPWIEELTSRGITGGCGNGNYCPTVAVTRQQMAAFLIRAIEAAVDGLVRSTVVKRESAVVAGTVLGDGTHVLDQGCNSDEILLSGGPANIAATTTLLESFPSPGTTNSWKVRVNKNGQTDNFSVVVLCAET